MPFSDEAAARFERDTAIAAPLLDEAFSVALRRIRALLATRCGSDAPVHVTDIRAIDQRGFLASEEVSSAVLWCAYTVEGGGGTALVAIEGRLLALWMGRLFGEGDTNPSAWQPRMPTSVERTVGGRLGREIMDALSEAWCAGPQPRFLFGSVAPTPRAAFPADQDRTLLMTTIQVGGDEAIGRLVVALPASLVLADAPPPPPVVVPRVVERIPQFDRILPVEMELVVELGRTQVAIGLLQNLEIGDEIQLGTISEVLARVGGRPAFAGEPGVAGGMRSFRVGRRVDFSSSPVTGDR